MSIETIRNPQGERIDHIYTPGRDGGRALVIVAHGVTSSHDRPYLIDICDSLARAGVASLRLSFAGNGRSEGRYEDCTISKEVEDLGAVIDACEGRRIGYVGHSMGGAVGVLRAARDARIQAMISLAGMARISSFMNTHFGGSTPGEDDMLDRPGCPLTRAFLDDAHGIADTFEHAARIQVPWLLLHGTEDELVPFSDSEELHARAGHNVELRPMLGVDHRFSGRNAELASLVTEWMSAHLSC